jgi:hypothetical protein
MPLLWWVVEEGMGGRTIVYDDPVEISIPREKTVSALKNSNN